MGLFDGLFGKDVISQLKSELAVKNEELRRATVELGNLRSRNFENEDALLQSHRALEEKEQNVQALTGALDESKSKANLLEKGLSDLQNASNEATQVTELHMRTLQEAKAKLELELSSARATNSELLDENERVKQASAERDSVYQEREAKLADRSEKLLSEKQKLQQQAADLHTREQHWKHSIEPKLRVYESHLALDIREAHVAELQSQLEEKQQVVEALDADMARRKCDDESLRKREIEVADWEKALSTLDQEVSGRQEKLDTLQKEQKSRSDSLEAWARELFVHQSRVNQLDREAERLDTLSKQLESQAIESKAQLDSKAAEVRAQRAEIRRQSAQLTEREEFIDSREAEVTRKEERIDVVNSKNLELKRQIKSFTLDVDNLKSQIMNSASAHSKLEAKYEKLHSAHQVALERLKRFGSSPKLASSLNHPVVIQWLLEDADPDSAEVPNGWLGSTGQSPWEEQQFKYAKEQLGYSFYQMPDHELEHIIVGRTGWSKEELINQIDSRDGEPIRIYSQEMFFCKLITGIDPFDTNDEELLDAFAQDHPALQFLTSLPEPWPTIAFGTGLLVDPVDEEDYGVSESPLHILGYRVGSTSNLSVTDRRAILVECFESKELTFSHDSSEPYIAKWGRGKSAQRLYRMATHIKSLADGRAGKDYRKPQARLDWVSDLKWLKDNFFAKYKTRFSWPG